jgi:branched-subunit amino acid aminotransferase/4-amino-4-deoxychorismate lyase
MDGKVYTTQATQGGHDSPVLAGSTRQLVLKACTRLGIDVVEQPPRLGEALQWQAAFVTSESLTLSISTFIP